MTEYFRERGQIQAGFALNAERLLTHYNDLTNGLAHESKWDVTLTVCVLQSLLTIFCESQSSKVESRNLPLFRDSLTDVPRRWGLSASDVQDTFPGDTTLERVLRQMRNALSHPTVPSERNAEWPSTGFTSVPDGSGHLRRLRFTASPWVQHGRLKTNARSTRVEDVSRLLEDLRRYYNDGGSLSVRPRGDGRYGVVDRGGRPYVPYLVVETPLHALTDLTRSLAEYLAEPANHRWEANVAAARG